MESQAATIAADAVAADSTPLVVGVEAWRPSGDGFQCVASWGGTEGDWSPASTHASLDDGVATRDAVITALESRSPAIAPLASADERFRVVAMPSVSGAEPCGVLCLVLQEDGDRQGAAEVWRPNDRGELARSDCWYAGLQRFGLVSGYVSFPRRAGLPGKVWADRFPRVMGKLGESSSFVRVAGAKAEGLSMAIGLPFMRSARELDSVLLLLSASRTPLARVMEVWAPDPDTKQLKVISADYGPYVDLAPISRRRRLKPGEGLAGRVFADGAPWVTTDLLGVEFPAGPRLGEYGFAWGAGFPVYVGAELFAAVSLLA